MNIFDNLQAYLEKRYRQELNVTLTQGEVGASQDVVWQHKQEDHSARLIDFGIGLLLNIYLIQQGDDVDYAIQRHIQKSLEEASNLKPVYGLSDDEADDFGPWQVGVLWVVQGAEMEKQWREVIANHRATSGFSEEIALDVIFYQGAETFEQELANHGLPLLLLHARELFKLQPDSMPAWLSANEKVRVMLQQFPRQFKQADQQKLAELLVKEVLAAPDTGNSERLPDSPATIESLEVDHCRNLRHCRLDFTPGPTHAHIVFGPNGTGKSTLFEALSMGLYGTSRMHSDYLSDDDITSTKKKEYLDRVLSPLDGGSVSIQVNKSVWNYSRLVGGVDEGKARLQRADGNLLAQEDSRGFLKESGKDLGARILSGYSTLAEDIQNKAARSYDQANTLRQDWLRRYNLKANITRTATRWQRLAEHVLDHEFPPAPRSLLEWMELAGRFFKEHKQHAFDLHQRWRQLDGDTGRAWLVEAIVAAGEMRDEHAIEEKLTAWLGQREALAGEVRRLIEGIKPAVESLRGEKDTLVQEIDQWSAWLISQGIAPSPEGVSNELQSMVAKIETERKLYQSIMSQGQFLRSRADHLKSIQEYFLPAWTKERPDECPTCGADHSTHNGIKQVVSDLLKHTDEALAVLRDSAKEKQVLLRQLEANLAAAGQCPITDERRDILKERFSGFTEDQSLESILTNPNSLSYLKQQLETLTHLPSIQGPIEDAVAKGSELAQSIISLNSEGERLWREPDRWKAIVDALKKECQNIVAHHLPQTLEAVWLETAMALTPAPWNLPARPRLNFKIERGNDKLTIVADGASRSVLARYLYNQAEQHLLGLAWFFARYLSAGRFRHALVALDDPAQEMDQTTYRAFTRYLRAILRMHKKEKRPLALLLFLHQEERALDAARATSGSLMMLSWEKELGSSTATTAIRRLMLLNEKFRDRLPEVEMN